MKKLLVVLLLLLNTLCFADTGKTNFINDRFAIGLNYPGLSAKFGFADILGLELRYQTDGNTSSAGGRGYLYLTPSSQFVLYLGGEYDAVTYKSSEVDTAGSYSGGFVGVELFLSPILSLSADIGGGQVKLNESKYNIETVTDSTVMNVGLNLYLSKPKYVAAEQGSATTKAETSSAATQIKESVSKPTATEKISRPRSETTEKINIAVSEFSGRNVSDMDAAMVSDFVREVLSKDDRFVLVERGSMDKILAEQRFQMTGCTTSECAIKLGRLLNVQKIVIGSLGKLESIYYITVSVIDVETSQRITDNAKCRSADELDSTTKELMTKLADEIR